MGCGWMITLNGNEHLINAIHHAMMDDVLSGHLFLGPFGVGDLGRELAREL